MIGAPAFYTAAIRTILLAPFARPVLLLAHGFKFSIAFFWLPGIGWRFHLFYICFSFRHTITHNPENYAVQQYLITKNKINHVQEYP